MQSEKFDIIISGGGMAGLSLVYRALKEGIWSGQKILIIEKDKKDQNDRTWCFWQKDEERSPFEEIIFRKWSDLLFFTNQGEKIKLATGTYGYKMIRSIDFYKHVLSFIEKFDQVSFINQDVKSVIGKADGAEVNTVERTYYAKYVFNSVYVKPTLKSHDQYFLQHFKGVTIQTSEFNEEPSQINFMDFRTSQKNGATFFYTLPLSRTEIFTEYTIFSKNLLTQEEYDAGIQEYIDKTLKINNYKIIEEEFGVIPMTDFSFQRRSGNVINIGSAGGDTRASTGYTFLNTQKTVSKIIKSFKENNHPFFKPENISRKHKLLDATILNVFDAGYYPGDEIFTDLFKNVAAKTIFKFLDSESSILDDLKIMTSLRAKYFIGPFLKVLANKQDYFKNS